MKSKLPLLFTFSLLIFGLVGCSTVPETGRMQFIDVSPADEAQMGLSAFADIKKQEKISTNAAANAQVQRVGKRIASSMTREIPNAEWEFVVFESDQVNAFALPGGKVGVYTGLLKLAASDDELACVMGHEIAHVSSRHGGERTTQTKYTNYALTGGAAITQLIMGYKSAKPETQQMVMGLYGYAAPGVANMGFLLPYSRKHETEADEIGLKYAAQAGYDPRAAATFWRKMAAANSGQTVQGSGGTKLKFSASSLSNLLSTHPSDADRIANLEKLAPSLMPVYEQAKLKFK